MFTFVCHTPLSLLQQITDVHLCLPYSPNFTPADYRCSPLSAILPQLYSSRLQMFTFVCHTRPTLLQQITDVHLCLSYSPNFTPADYRCTPLSEILPQLYSSRLQMFTFVCHTPPTLLQQITDVHLCLPYSPNFTPADYRCSPLSAILPPLYSSRLQMFTFVCHTPQLYSSRLQMFTFVCHTPPTLLQQITDVHLCLPYSPNFTPADYRCSPLSAILPQLYSSRLQMFTFVCHTPPTLLQQITDVHLCLPYSPNFTPADYRCSPLSAILAQLYSSRLQMFTFVCHTPPTLLQQITDVHLCLKYSPNFTPADYRCSPLSAILPQLYSSRLQMFTFVCHTPPTLLQQITDVHLCLPYYPHFTPADYRCSPLSAILPQLYSSRLQMFTFVCHTPPTLLQQITDVHLCLPYSPNFTPADYRCSPLSAILPQLYSSRLQMFTFVCHTPPTLLQQITDVHLCLPYSPNFTPADYRCSPLSAILPQLYSSRLQMFTLVCHTSPTLLQQITDVHLCLPYSPNFTPADYRFSPLSAILPQLYSSRLQMFTFVCHTPPTLLQQITDVHLCLPYSPNFTPADYRCSPLSAILPQLYSSRLQMFTFVCHTRPILLQQITDVHLCLPYSPNFTPADYRCSPLSAILPQLYSSRLQMFAFVCHTTPTLLQQITDVHLGPYIMNKIYAGFKGEGGNQRSEKLETLFRNNR